MCFRREYNYTYIRYSYFKIVHTLVVLFLRLEISFNNKLIQVEFARKFIDFIHYESRPHTWLEPRDKIIFTFN